MHGSIRFRSAAPDICAFVNASGTSVRCMRVLISLAILLTGIGLLVFGSGRVLDVFDGNGAGPIVIGVILTVLGTALVRSFSSGSREAPLANAERPRDHSLTAHHARLPHATQQTPALPSDARTRRPLVGIAILIAVALVGGLIGGLAGEFSDHPNVPLHVVDACASALADSEGSAAIVGEPNSYNAVGDSLSVVTFETSDGWTWRCTYEIETGDATASERQRL